MSEFVFGDIALRLAEGWLDVTHENESPDSPFTLAKSDGVGTLQFSTAIYVSGKLPGIRIQDLQQLLADFAGSRELKRARDKWCQESRLLICAESFDYREYFMRAWYCSNGRDVALVTYVGVFGLEQAELPDCETMVASIEFLAKNPR